MKLENQLPDEVIQSINIFLEQKKHEYESLFVNTIIRDDILNILEKFCTVLYYPLNDDDNDGCHVKRYVNGQVENFVYINTYKPIEKQVFTAAHELGHIWKLEDYLEQSCKSYRNQMSEPAMNRFAAALLIPEKSFLEFLIDNKSRFLMNDNYITLNDLLKLIVLLMAHFFVPFKAVVLRLVETKKLDSEIGVFLLQDETILTNINNYIKEAGESRLGQRNRLKSIKGYPELLAEVENKSLFPKEKIEEIRHLMDIPKIDKKTRTNLTEKIELNLK